MTKEELDKKVERTLAESRAAIAKAEAFSREFDRLAPIHALRTEQAFRELREAIRRRKSSGR